jgi:hypothetical protein
MITDKRELDTHNNRYSYQNNRNTTQNLPLSFMSKSDYFIYVEFVFF